MWSVIYSELSAFLSIQECAGEINDMQLEQALLRLQQMTLAELIVEFTTITGKSIEVIYDYIGS